jgi:hypothetical protein
MGMAIMTLVHFNVACVSNTESCLHRTLFKPLIKYVDIGREMKEVAEITTFNTS